MINTSLLIYGTANSHTKKATEKSLGRLSHRVYLFHLRVVFELCSDKIMQMFADVHFTDARCP